MQDREAPSPASASAYDLVPLIALIVISVTGLLLTFSSVFLHGGGYQFLAILHMAVGGLHPLYIPFGKFFHIVQRPAAVGMQLFKYTGRQDDQVWRLPALRGADRHRPRTSRTCAAPCATCGSTSTPGPSTARAASGCCAAAPTSPT